MSLLSYARTMIASFYHWRMLTCFGVSVLKGSRDEHLSKEGTGDCGCCFVSLSISFEIDSYIAKGQAPTSKGWEPGLLY